MSILTFKGGVHPYDGKELSKEEPIVEYNPQGEIAIAVSQHIGAPAKPLVSKGDSVSRSENCRGCRIYFSKCSLIRIRNSKGY